MALTLMGKDFEFPDLPGRILHNHSADRDSEDFKGTNRIWTGGRYPSHVVLPQIKIAPARTI